MHVAGYWDYYPFDARGWLFAPAYFGAGYRQGAYYRPSVAIDAAQLALNLFVGPRFGGYYFGDYYGNNYWNAGYRPWYKFSWGRQYYDPVFVYNNWYYGRNNRDWITRLDRRYDDLIRDRDARPPKVWRDDDRDRRITVDKRDDFKIARRADELPKQIRRGGKSDSLERVVGPSPRDRDRVRIADERGADRRNVERRDLDQRSRQQAAERRSEADRPTRREVLRPQLDDAQRRSADRDRQAREPDRRQSDRPQATPRIDRRPEQPRTPTADPRERSDSTRRSSEPRSTPPANTQRSRRVDAEPPRPQTQRSVEPRREVQREARRIDPNAPRREAQQSQPTRRAESRPQAERPRVTAPTERKPQTSRAPDRPRQPANQGGGKKEGGGKEAGGGKGKDQGKGK